MRSLLLPLSTGSDLMPFVDGACLFQRLATGVHETIVFRNYVLRTHTDTAVAGAPYTPRCYRLTRARVDDRLLQFRIYPESEGTTADTTAETATTASATTTTTTAADSVVVVVVDERYTRHRYAELLAPPYLVYLATRKRLRERNRSSTVKAETARNLRDHACDSHFRWLIAIANHEVVAGHAFSFEQFQIEIVVKQTWFLFCKRFPQYVDYYKPLYLHLLKLPGLGAPFGSRGGGGSQMKLYESQFSVFVVPRRMGKTTLIMIIHAYCLLLLDYDQPISLLVVSCGSALTENYNIAHTIVRSVARSAATRPPHIEAYNRIKKHQISVLSRGNKTASMIFTPPDARVSGGAGVYYA